MILHARSNHIVPKCPLCIHKFSVYQWNNRVRPPVSDYENIRSIAIHTARYSIGLAAVGYPLSQIADTNDNDYRLLIFMFVIVYSMCYVGFVYTIEDL